MTVEEMIEKLKELNPDLIILRASGMGFENVLDVEMVGDILSLDEPDIPQIYAVVY